MGSAAVEGLLNHKKGMMVTWNCNQISLKNITEMLTTPKEFDLNSYELATRLSL
jgi:6-phosphofructokinase